MDIEIRRPHSFDTKDLVTRTIAMAEGLKEELHLELSWRGDHKAIEFESTGGLTKGIKGEIELDPEFVCVRVKLPFGLKPMRSSFERVISDEMDERLA
ncbi:MAG: polyhydroxyalkanoic acid system family protein [Parcubacteria group bacterium]|jgi:hypothetical protein